jgi:hypothetical protein
VRTTGRTRVIAILTAGGLGALVVLPGLLAGAVGAQQAPPATKPAAASAPATTQPPPSEILPSTTTIVAPFCTPIPPPYLVFVGRITAYQVPTFRFEVQEVKSGKWDGPLIDVQFLRDAGFLRLGPSYLVAAQVDRATGKLYSKVRSSFASLPKPGTCPGEDPIITKMANGKPVDTGLLTGMKGRWNKVGVAFLVPAVAVLGVLILLVSLKHLLTRVLRVSPVSSRRRPYAE